MTKGPRIPPERWAEAAVRAKDEGLRAVARDFGVSARDGSFGVEDDS